MKCLACIGILLATVVFLFVYQEKLVSLSTPSQSKSEERVFIDVTQEAGIHERHFGPVDIPAESLVPGSSKYYMYYHMAGGVAVGDYDNDGWDDIYLPRFFNTDILYRNNQDGTFTDVTADVNLDTTTFNASDAEWGDIDNDGDLDLFVVTMNELRYFLFINDNGTFVEQAIERNAAVSTNFRHTAFHVSMEDYDNDGYLDITISEWRLQKLTDGINHARLLRNQGAEAPGYFEDVTQQSGLLEYPMQPGLYRPYSGGDSFESARTFSFEKKFIDLDNDGWKDLIVASDYGTSRLYWNNGDGTFTDGTEVAGVGTDENGMGIATSDYDQDGDQDFFITAIYHPESVCADVSGCETLEVDGNRLYQNNGDRTFTDVTTDAQVRDSGWAWGAVFFDFDNDGDDDLFSTNGFTLNPLMSVRTHIADTPSVLWRNDNGVFTDVSSELGFTQTTQGRHTAVFDFDNDGWDDLLVVNSGEYPVLYRNSPKY